MCDCVVDLGLGYWKWDFCMKSVKGKLLVLLWLLGCFNWGWEYFMEGLDMKDFLENFFGSIGIFVKEEFFFLFLLGGSFFFDFVGCIY